MWAEYGANMSERWADELKVLWWKLERKKVLIYIEIVFFLNMGEEKSFTNIYKVQEGTKCILFFYCVAEGRIKGIRVKALGFEKIKKDHQV